MAEVHTRLCAMHKTNEQAWLMYQDCIYVLPRERRAWSFKCIPHDDCP
jgi:hypothetical protein